jgi:hypothetical protein
MLPRLAEEPASRLPGFNRERSLSLQAAYHRAILLAGSASTSQCPPGRLTHETLGRYVESWFAMR